MTRRLLACLITCLALAPGIARAALIPIDPGMFTIQSFSGAASWAGDSLTLHLPTNPIFGDGAFTQTAQFAPSLLPAGITGIEFTLSTTSSALAQTDFGLVVYDQSGIHGLGALTLIGDPSDPPLTSFRRRTQGFGVTTDILDVPLGADYSPFALTGPTQNSLYSYPLVSLDFRSIADPLIRGGDTVFANIEWVTSDVATVPEPAEWLLLALGLLGVGLLKAVRP